HQAGLIARYSGTGDTNLYLGLVAGTSGTYVSAIWKNVNGTWTQLATGSVPSAGLGALRFDAPGNLPKLYFTPTGSRESLRATATDSRLTGAGLVGVRGISTTYDNLSLKKLPPLPFSDNFNRADSTSLGQNWAEQTGDLSVSGNHLAGASSVNVGTYTGASATDVTVMADVTAAS